MLFSRKVRERERGQILILCAVTLVVLLLFVGLAIDFGMAYLTKASLGKAVDAAALTGAKNLYKGQPTAINLANTSFGMNYANSGRDVSTPVPLITFSTDSAGNKLMKVTANTAIKTYFIGMLPGYRTLNVSASAQSFRARVKMTLVLDTSRSMRDNGGWSALPGDVEKFIDYFDDTMDSVGMVHFASNVTVDVPIKTGGFATLIKNKTGNMDYDFFNGGTFSDGALQEAMNQDNTPLPIPGNVVKVVVFFTDGYANTIQDKLDCGTKDVPDGRWNFGGWDDTNKVRYFHPTGGSQDDVCVEPPASKCCGVKFPSHLTGKLEPIIASKIYPDAHGVGGEAQYRALQTANTMRSSANNIAIYTIGLGNDINKDFLYQLANDPDPANTHFDSSQPAGEAKFAPTPAELEAVFREIAADILLRLTQ